MNYCKGKDYFKFELKMFKYLGLDPKAGVEYIENKDIADIDPQHVTALLILRGSPVPSS